jgi:hypothetical protein
MLTETFLLDIGIKSNGRMRKGLKRKICRFRDILGTTIR